MLVFRRSQLNITFLLPHNHINCRSKHNLFHKKSCQRIISDYNNTNPNQLHQLTKLQYCFKGHTSIKHSQTPLPTPKHQKSRFYKSCFQDSIFSLKVSTFLSTFIMIFSLKQPHLTTTTGFTSKIINHHQNYSSKFLNLPSLSNPKTNKIKTNSNHPLHVSLIKSFGSLKSFDLDDQRVVCKAYEADRSDGVEKIEAAKRVKIGVYFATWWFLNVIFNIYNKKVLNAFPYPWLTSTLSLAAGSAIMLVSWATKVAEAPNTDLEFWKSLFPVALAHTIGHVAATVSMSKVAVSFTHIIKSGEPAFSVLVSRFILGETFPTSVYLSLLPIIGGCGLAALTELNFNMIGFMGAMISNLAFVFRNIFSKRGMKGKSVSGMNYYACLSLLSLMILTPFAIAVEGPKVWAAGWQNAVSEIGPHFIWWVAAQSIFYHLYNQVSYMSLDEISPLTFSIGNTMKRISVIVSSIIIFHTPVQPINALGAAIAIFGTFLYSQAKQ